MAQHLYTLPPPPRRAQRRSAEPGMRERTAPELIKSSQEPRGLLPGSLPDTKLSDAALTSEPARPKRLLITMVKNIEKE